MDASVESGSGLVSDMFVCGMGVADVQKVSERQGRGRRLVGNSEEE